MNCSLRLSQTLIASLCLCLLAACDGGTSKPSAPFSAPAAASVDADTSLTLQPSGGLTPYGYQIVYGGGTIDPSTGVFNAPHKVGTTVVQLSDAAGSTQRETLTINAPFTANSTELTVARGTTQVISATGGQGPFTYSVLSGGGSVDASGVYSAPKANGSAVVQITDFLGTTVNVTLTIVSDLVIFPSSATLTAGSGLTFQVTGQRGVPPPYSYTLISGPGSLTAKGVYTVGSEGGIAAVQISDSEGATAVAKFRLLRIRVNGPVWATATDGTSLYLGGRFNAANPYSAPHLLLVDQNDGNPIMGCDLGTGFLDGVVTAVVASGNSIYVGGGFNLYNGVSVGNLVKIDATTCKLDTTFTRGGEFGPEGGFAVTSMALSGNSLFVGGTFVSYRGAPAVAVAKIDAMTGELDPGFSVGSGTDTSGVSTVVVSGNSVYVGGGFSQVNGVPATYVAKLDIKTGAVDTNFAGPSFTSGGAVLALAASGSYLYLAGSFQQYGSVATSFAKVDATTGAVDVAFTQNVSPYTQVNAILPIGTSVYVGRTAYDKTTRLAKVDSATGVTDTVFTKQAGFNYAVQALALVGSSLYVGGDFTFYRGQPANYLAKIDATTGALDTTFTGVTGGDSRVSALAAAGSVLVAGGQITTYGGQPVYNLAKFNLASGQLDPSFLGSPQPGSLVNALALNAGSLYVGGDFTQYQTAQVGYLAKVDASSGLIDNTFAQAGGVPAFSLAVLLHGGSLYVAGGESSKNFGYVKKIDLVSGLSDPAFAGQTDGQVDALAVSGSSLYVGGEFHTYAGSATGNLAKVDVATGVVDQAFTQGSGATFSNPPGIGVSDVFVDALLATGSALYVGGDFDTYRGVKASGLIKVDAVSGALDTAFASQPGPTAFIVQSLATDGVSLYSGGFFFPTGSPFQILNVVKRDLVTGVLDSAFYDSKAVTATSMVNFSMLSMVGQQLYVGADTGILYRGATSIYAFPIDTASGAPLDPH